VQRHLLTCNIHFMHSQTTGQNNNKIKAHANFNFPVYTSAV